MLISLVREIRRFTDSFVRDGDLAQVDFSRKRPN